MTDEKCIIAEKNNIARNVYDIWVLSPGITSEAHPGQFVNIKCGSFTLRRPISICEINQAAGKIRLVFEIRGDGTAWLAQQNTGVAIDILGPLGNGFRLLDMSKPAVFVGGGIGVPPLLGAAAPFGEKATAILGFKDAAAVILERDFENYGAEVKLCTNDGSAGEKGFVTGPLETRLKENDGPVVYACGPRPMLKAVAETAQKYGVQCFVSMEQRMACGVGACLSCACKVKTGGREKYLHVCKNGPVFDAKTIIW